MNELALFAGAGGGILGGKLLGWRTVCAVEWEPYAAGVLAARQNDKVLEPFPIWDDVQTFDGKPWRGIVDVVSGGFPCQDISAAGKGAGISGDRSGLWKHMSRIIGEVRPRLVFVENSPILTSRGLGVVLGDLASLGFDAQWGVVSAADAGAPHLRERIWIVANASGERYGVSLKEVRTRGNAVEPGCEVVADTNSDEINGRRSSMQMGRCRSSQEDGNHGFSFRNEWPTEPNVGRVANGVAARVDRLKALGNGQVPRVAAAAFAILAEQLMTANA